MMLNVVLPGLEQKAEATYLTLLSANCVVEHTRLMYSSQLTLIEI